MPIHCETCETRGKSVFCDLSEHHLRELDDAKTANTFKPKQTIFYEGNEPLGLYCISSGKVKIFKTDADGNQQIVRLAGSSDILGYRALLAGETYHATAEALEESRICFIDRNTFTHVLKTHPKTAFEVMTLLATDLGSAEENVVRVAHRSVKERLAELLLILRTKYGSKNASGVHLNISLTRQEIADLIGTTQESAIRLISEFKQSGLIQVEKRDITLVDIEKLVEIAHISF